MNKEDIIRMAREAGIITNSPYLMPHDHVLHGIERFAALVAAAEREACAKMCENMTLEWEDQPSIAQAELATMMDCALAIRSRGTA